MSPRRSFWLRQLRIIVLSFREFNRDRCSLHASALTFYTLISIVPMLAMAFGVAKGFAMQEKLKEFVVEKLDAHSEIVTYLLDFTDKLLENVKGGFLVGAGVLFLIWTTIKVLGNIESTFNDIWGIKRGRTLTRKFSDYLSFILVSPIVFVVANTMTVSLIALVQDEDDPVAMVQVLEKGETEAPAQEKKNSATLLQDMSSTATLLQDKNSTVTLVQEKSGGVAQRFESLKWILPVIILICKLLPILLFIGLFTFAYMFMPNGKVRFSSGFVGGVVAGVLYIAVQRVYVHFQIGVASYNAIYGSFSAIPLFLIWLQVSWLVVLYGAEVSFAHQNVDTYEFEPECLKVSPSFKRLVTLEAARRCVRAFDRADGPAPSAEDISHAMSMPIRLINQVLFELVESGVLAEVRRRDKKKGGIGYQPARNIETMTLQSVLDLLESNGADPIPHSDEAVFEELAESLGAFREQNKDSDANVRIMDIRLRDETLES